MFRRAARELKQSPAQLRRWTLSQLLAALSRPDDDPHAGNVPITSTAQLDEMWGELFPDG